MTPETLYKAACDRGIIDPTLTPAEIRRKCLREARWCSSRARHARDEDQANNAQQAADEWRQLAATLG